MVTDMRLLASVGPRVYGQGTALNKALVAVLYGAMIRPLIGVNAIMATEIGFAIEGLRTMLPRAVKVAPTAWSHDETQERE